MIDPKLRLKKLIESKKIPHALIFCGSKEGLEREAYDFASLAILNEIPMAAQKIKAKSHPDIHFFRPEGRTGMHGIESLRKLIQEVSLNCVEATQKFFIVLDAERCLPTSSNALLKTLEEPVSHSVIMLLTSKPERLLPTVVSRCQKIYFPKGDKSVYNSYQNRLLGILTGTISREGLEELCLEIENERKEWEKKMLKELPKDLAVSVRERLEKEIESASALDYQEKAFSLLETFLLWMRDIAFFHMGVPSKHLVHHVHLSHIAKSPKIPYTHVEKSVSMMKVAIERSTNLQTCLEALLTEFGY